MKLTAFLLTLLIILISAADNRFLNSDGLFVEVPDTKNQNQNFFNKDNKIYLPGREFVFSYTIKKNHSQVYCRVNEVGDSQTKNWKFVKPNEIDDLTIKFLGFKVLAGYGGLDDLFPDYSQTVIQQEYWSSKMSLLFDGSTGLIENDANVWLHPFRGKYFSATQFSPFPFAKFPLKKGQTWEWKLDDIDDRWSDPRIITYSGKLIGNYKYEMVDTKNISTPLGKLECSVIDGVSRNRIGSAKLRSFFNSKYGFVRLEYQNIDRSEIILDLTKVLEPRVTIGG